MAELKHCPKRRDDYFNCGCHIEIIRTAEAEPNNIRVLCATHSFVLPGSYSSVEEAEEAWNRRAEEKEVK